MQHRRNKTGQAKKPDGDSNSNGFFTTYISEHNGITIGNSIIIISKVQSKGVKLSIKAPKDQKISKVGDSTDEK